MRWIVLLQFYLHSLAFCKTVPQRANRLQSLLISAAFPRPSIHLRSCCAYLSNFYRSCPTPLLLSFFRHLSMNSRHARVCLGCSLIVVYQRPAMGFQVLSPFAIIRMAFIFFEFLFMLLGPAAHVVRYPFIVPGEPIM